MHRSRGRRDGWEKRKTRANYGRAKRGRMQGLRFRENALSKSGNKGGRRDEVKRHRGGKQRDVL